MTFTRITVRADQMDGVPCIRGLRIPVATVVGMIAEGMPADEVLDAYPDLERPRADLELADVQEALQYAAEAVQAALLRANLPQLVGALDAGSIVVIQPDRIRIRTLPLIP